MKKVIILLSIVILLIMIIFCNYSYATTDLGLGNLSNYKGNTNSQEIEDRAGNLLAIVQAVGIVISVVMLIVIGIKYMLGSVSERAEYKKTLIPYLVGAFMVFAATVIPGLVYEFVKNF